MAKYNKKNSEESSSKHILLTSSYKNISKQAIEYDVFNWLYKVHCAALELNGISPKVMGESRTMNSEYGAYFIQERKTFTLFKKDIVKLDLDKSSLGCSLNAHIYNIKTGEEFSKEEVDNIFSKYVKSYEETNNFDDIDECIRNLNGGKGADDKVEKVEESDETEDELMDWDDSIGENVEYKDIEDRELANMIANNKTNLVVDEKKKMAMPNYASSFEVKLSQLEKTNDEGYTKEDFYYNLSNKQELNYQSVVILRVISLSKTKALFDAFNVPNSNN